MDTAQTRWTVRHKQHIRREVCFFAGGSVGTKLGTGIAPASIAGIMSLCAMTSSLRADIHKKFIAAALRLSALPYIISAEHIPVAPIPITE